MPKHIITTPIRSQTRAPRYGTPFSKVMKQIIWDRDEGLCVYCGEPGVDVDHVIPRRRGGPSIRENAVLACKSCNTTKAGRAENLRMITRAFYHLLSKGESLKWLDGLS